MTFLELVKNTFDFYCADLNRRAVGNDLGITYYSYETEDGRNCAIGRYLKEPGQFRRLNGSIMHVLGDDIKRSDLKPEIQDLTDEALGFVQWLHDSFLDDTSEQTEYSIRFGLRSYDLDPSLAPKIFKLYQETSKQTH